MADKENKHIRNHHRERASCFDREQEVDIRGSSVDLPHTFRCLSDSHSDTSYPPCNKYLHRPPCAWWFVRPSLTLLHRKQQSLPALARHAVFLDIKLSVLSCTQHVYKNKSFNLTTVHTYVHTFTLSIFGGNKEFDYIQRLCCVDRQPSPMRSLRSNEAPRVVRHC